MRILALFALGFVLSLGQTPSKYDKTEGYVSDFARVLDSPSQIDIERVCREVETSSGVQIAVVTIPSLEGEPIEDFTNSLARKWGVGQKGSNQGLMLLLSIGDRKVRTEVGYGLEPVMPDGFVGTVQRSMREELREGRYGAAILGAVLQFQKRIEDSRTGVPAPQQPVGPRGFSHSPFPIWVMMAMLAFFFVVIPWLSRRGSRSGYRRGSRFYNSGGVFPVWTGGGFGGSSDYGGGGSGFGGFGGGDFGGGGSTSDW